MTRDTFVRLTALAALVALVLVAAAGHEKLAVILFYGVAALATVYALAEDVGSAWTNARRYRSGLGDPSTRRGRW